MTLTLLALTAALAQDAGPGEVPAPEPAAEPAPKGPSAARRCADAAEGTEIEVCLQLAAEAPDEVDAVAAALVAHIDQASSADRDLLGALLLLVSDETGVQGARRLGELGDPRAIGPLTHAGETRDTAVAVAAARALVAYPESIEPLSRWVADESIDVEIRRAAAEALGVLGSDGAADALLLALRTRRVPPPLRTTLIDVVASSYPNRADELSGQVTRDGSAWLAAGGAFGLGYSLAMAGAFGRAELAGFGGVTGGVAGGTLGWVAGRAWPMEASDAAFVTTTGVLSTTGGIVLGAAFEGAQTPWWTGLGAGAVGYTASAGFRRAYDGTVLDSFEAGGLSGMAGLAAGTTALLADPSWDPSVHRRVDAPVLATGIGFLGGLAAGHLVAPRVEIRQADAPLLGLTSAYGLAAGLLVPGQRRAIYPWVGLSYGTLTGYGLAGAFDVPVDWVFGAGAGAVFLGVSGAGLGMLLGDGDETAIRATALVGSAVGLGVGGYLSARNEDVVDKGDVLFTGLVTSWASWQAAGWYAVMRPNLDSPGKIDGLFLLGPAIAGGVAGALSPYYDVPISYSFTGISMGLWGGYLGGTAAELANSDVDSAVLQYALLGSNVGVAAGIVLAVPPLSASPLVIGMANAGGVLGGSLFALGTAFADDRTDPILGMSLVGAGVGFTTGAIVGSVVHRRGGTREIAGLSVPHLRLPGRWSVTPAAFADEEDRLHYGATLSVIGW